MLASEAIAHARTHERQPGRPALCRSTRYRGAPPGSDVAVMTRHSGTCEHLASTGDVWHQPPAFCEECLADPNDSLNLRVCLNCGHVGCAEGSPSDHAAQHYAETDHPIAAAVGSQPAARWCYPHRRLV
jgi:hypothetical protein